MAFQTRSGVNGTGKSNRFALGEARCHHRQLAVRAALTVGLKRNTCCVQTSGEIERFSSAENSRNLNYTRISVNIKLVEDIKGYKTYLRSLLIFSVFWELFSSEVWDLN